MNHDPAMLESLRIKVPTMCIKANYSMSDLDILTQETDVGLTDLSPALPVFR